MAPDRKDLATDEKKTESDPIKDQDEKEVVYHPFENQDDNDLVEDMMGIMREILREICRAFKVWEVPKMWKIWRRWREKKNQYSESAFEFYAINRRISHQFCLPILDKISFIYYCAFAKLPGMWVATSLRKNNAERVVGKEPIDKTNLVYRRKEHIVETCLRMMIGKQFEELFGSCNYSMTYYYQHDNNYLLRISMPHDTKFMMIFNVYDDFLDGFEFLFPESYWKIIRDPMNLKELKELCEKALERRKDQLAPDGPTHPLFATLHPPFLSIFLKSCFGTSDLIRTATIGTIDSGVIFGHYVKEGLTPFLSKYDLYEYFVEFASRIKMRYNIEQFFGNVNFVLTVYDNVAVMAIPIGVKLPKTKDETKEETKDEPVVRFLLLLSLETEIKKNGKTIDKDQIYFPPHMNEIRQFISEQKMEYLTTGL